MKSNKVAVFMPVYNGADMLPLSLDSLINQEYENWIAFVTDDCSTDKTWEVLKKYALKDPRIIPLQNTSNIGCGASRNTGMRIAHEIGCFDYYSFLDCDDMWFPNHLSNVIKEFQIPDKDNTYPDMVYTKCRILYYPDWTDAEELRPSHTPENFDFKILYWYGNYIMVSTTTVNKLYVDHIGFFDPNFRALEDWDYWLRGGLTRKNFRYLPVEDVTYTRNREGTLSDKILETLPAIKRKYGF